VHGDDVSKAHAQVFADDFVHADLALFAMLVCQHDAHRVLPLLAFDKHRVAAEQLELVHLGKIQRHDAVIIVHGLICARKRARERE